MSFWFVLKGFRELISCQKEAIMLIKANLDKIPDR